MPSIDALIGALKDYTGTLVFVSHDVHFIRAIAKHTIQIQAGSTTNFAGDYDYYLRKSEATSEKSGLVAGIKNARPDFEAKPSQKPKVVSAKERRRIEAEKRKLESKGRKGVEKRVAKLEVEVLKLEAEQAAVTKQLGNPGVYADKEKAKELNMQSARISKRLQEKNYEWETAADELGKLMYVLEQE
jgi:ATP-binding cassette subfamily F protein 3